IYLSSKLSELNFHKNSTNEDVYREYMKIPEIALLTTILSSNFLSQQTASYDNILQVNELYDERVLSAVTDPNRQLHMISKEYISDTSNAYFEALKEGATHIAINFITNKDLTTKGNNF